MNSCTEGATCFWRHRWGKWTVKSEGETKNDGRVIGKVVIQQRQCQRCDQIELRTAEARISLWA